MAAYKYKAMDGVGNISTGRIDALNIADLELRLRKMGLDLINCKKFRHNSLFSGGKRINRQELITFSYHMEQLLRSGVPILDGLGDLRDSASNPDIKETVTAIIEAIEGGKTLSESMEPFPEVFDNVFVSLIRAGEESGMLADVFRKITNSLKWQDELISQTKRIMIYPVIVGVFIISVMFFLMIYLVPKLVLFIKAMGEEIPVHTKLLVYTSEFTINYWYLILLTPLILFYVVKLVAKYKIEFRYKLDELKLNIWLVGPIIKKIILVRFANYFSLLYASGITILNCIQINEAIAGNLVMQDALKKMRVKIADGNSISDSIDSTSLFPPLVLRMIKVGESTGELESALGNVSYFYNREIRESIDKVQAMLGPVMILMLGLLLGWIMVSVLWPIYDIMVRVQI